MSFATDSPVHSSSSDDFAALIDAELEVGSSGSSPDEQDNEEEEVDADSDDENGDDEEDDSNDDLNDHRNKRCKTEKLDDLEGPQGSTSQGLIEEKLEVSLNKDTCTHPGSFGQMCILCGQRVDDESGVTFGYIHKGLRLGNDEIVRLRSTDMKNLLRHKKLYLVLDLDHTLLNSTQLNHLTAEEEYLKGQSDSLQDVSKGSLFMLEFMHMMTKLRPFVRTFLKEASEMFEMYIYTMGDRPYALEMAKLLDPKKEYFNGRVISRDDGTQKHQKGLDVVLGQDSAVVILDDTENAWTKHKDNLILMERYHFFASSSRQFGFDCKAKNRNKKKRSGVSSMDVNEGTVPDLPQAMDTSETGVQKPDSATAKLKTKKGRPMKRSKNVRKMKAVEKAIAKNEKYAEKSSKTESKKSRTQSAKLLYD